MNDRVGPWVRRFLVEYLIGERNYSLHTQQSRRDTFVLFLPFAAKRRRCALEQLALSQINPKLVREFVRHLEQVRLCSPSTINQRVISLRAWARYVGITSPEHLEWNSQMLALHLKKHAPAPMNFVDRRPSAQPVFLDRHGQALTRYGMHTLVERHARQAALTTPTLRTKRVSPHTIRHAMAMALLRSGVDINTIRIWLGHVSLQTTHLYAESDLKMKAKALARCEAPLLEEHKGPSPRKGLIGFLRNL